MPGRSLSLGGYRFGFQGQETDDEVFGEGNAVSYKYRVHDARIGRFLSIDPLAPEYPFWTPYAFSGNRVIDAVELEGLEPQLIAPYLYGLNKKYSITTRALGLLQGIGGIGEMAVAAPLILAPEPVTTAAGTGLAAHGADNATAGFTTLWTGRHSKTMLTQGLEAAGVPEGTAETADAVVGAALSGNAVGLQRVWNSTQIPLRNVTVGTVQTQTVSKYKFQTLGYKYRGDVDVLDDGAKQIRHFLVKDGEEIPIGFSNITSKGKLSNTFDVPEGLQQKGASRAMYEKLNQEGFSSVSSTYMAKRLPVNYNEFMKVYDPTIGNEVEAALSTPAGKALGPGWKPTNIIIKEGSDVQMDWIKNP